MQNENNIEGKLRNRFGKRVPVVLHPDPALTAERLSITAIERFMKKIEFTDTCWIWRGATSEKGDPRMLRNKRQSGNISARRVSWLLYNGAIPDGFEILKACPFRRTDCVHPNHIHLGGHDELKKVRQMSKIHIALSTVQQRTMDIACEQAGLTHRQLAERTDGSHQTPQWMIALGFSDGFAGRFWANVKKTESCWLWTGCKNSDGYGGIGIGGDRANFTIGAHRASWMLHNGPIPEGLSILHDCPDGDNPACVNPAHLSPGTHQRNIEDAVEKQFSKTGGHWHFKVSPQQVEEIRILSKHGHGNTDLAKRFGISAAHVHRIVKCKVRIRQTTWCWEI